MVKILNFRIVVFILFSTFFLTIIGCNSQVKPVSDVSSNNREPLTSTSVSTQRPSETRNVIDASATAVTMVVATATATAIVTSTKVLPATQVTYTPTLILSFTPRPSRTIPEVTATAQILIVKPNLDEPRCNRPNSLQETEVDITEPPFCIVWIDEFDDEDGFRVHLDYFGSGEHFVYEVSPNVTQLIVPEMDTPRLNESFEQCIYRNSFMVKVVALRETIEQRVNSMAATIECGGIDSPPLPTATLAP